MSAFDFAGLAAGAVVSFVICTAVWGWFEEGDLGNAYGCGFTFLPASIAWTAFCLARVFGAHL